MSLDATLNILLEEFPKAKQDSFASNPVAEFIRKDAPEELRPLIASNDRYLIQGSAGQGNWAHVPWVAVFDRLITESAQEGYYLVYLVREDFAGIYLSLNQGVTSVKQQYGTDAKRALLVRATDYVARLGNLVDDLTVGPIDLSASSSLGMLYEKGSICSIYYEQGNIPADINLCADFRHFLDLYLALVSRETRLFEHVDEEEDEEGLANEDLRILREHKRIERNKKLAAQAKKFHGCKCKACGFDFEKQYGDLGKGFIEAHHLTPLSLLKGQKLTLSPKMDFTVLCANCHRMIHRSPYVGDVNSFIANCLRFRS